MRTSTTLSRLTYDDFARSPAWRAVGDYANDEDKTLEPVTLGSAGVIPEHVEEVWCLCVATFADGSEHQACAMCRGDSADGPLVWSVWNGEKDVPVILPPAPPDVLKLDGPDAFAAGFGLSLEEVFPVRLKVVPTFASEPSMRRVVLDSSGVRES